MIKNGSWEFDLYRMIPDHFGREDPELQFFISFDDNLIRGAVRIYKESPIICFSPWTREIKDPENTIIYSEELYSPSPLHQIDLARTPTRAHELILSLFKQHKTYFSDNDCGENVSNWLKYATKGGLKV